MKRAAAPRVTASPVSRHASPAARPRALRAAGRRAVRAARDALDPSVLHALRCRQARTGTLRAATRKQACVHPCIHSHQCVARWVAARARGHTHTLTPILTPVRTCAPRAAARRLGGRQRAAAPAPRRPGASGPEAPGPRGSPARPAAAAQTVTG